MLKILDCTLRDGGYYNNWDFDPEIVNCYLKAVAESKIDYVELGLRNFAKPNFLGAFAYTTEEFLESLNLPDGPTYGVMVDAKTILTSGLEVKEAVEKLFIDAKHSKVGLVRVAAHFNEVDKCEPIINLLKAKGYIVGFNLMQAGGKPEKVIREKAKLITSWKVLDVLYFADSLGNMDATEVERVYSSIRAEWGNAVGIHTHNNMNRGLDNTLTARELGVEWLDVTVTGMGRGAGNTQTENLLAVLDKENSSYSSKPIYELVIRHFETMQRKYGWGSNLLYFLGAQNDVHPTYIQNLLSNTHYGTDEIVGAIDYLSSLEGTTSYSGDVLDSALDFSSKNSVISGDSSTSGIFDGRDILLITNAPSTPKYATAVESFIKKVKPIVISINVVDSISSELIDYYVLSHNSKFLADINKYNKLDKSVILPKHRFLDTELEAFNKIQVLDYGLEVNKNEFEVHESYVTVPHDNTTAYALGLLMRSNVKDVFAVGFDGYELDDVRLQEMSEIILKYNRMENTKPITALTPTAYQIERSSIYAPR